MKDHSKNSQRPAQPHATLADLKDGQQAEVSRLLLPEDAGWKLMEMGFGAGRPVKVIRRAPLGDPLEVEILGYRLAIRLNEARGVQVVRVSQGAKP